MTTRPPVPPSLALMLAAFITPLAVAQDSSAGLLRSRARAEFIPLGELPGGKVGSFATGISRDGFTVVGYSSSAASEAGPAFPDTGAHGTEAFLWRRTTGMIGLGDLPGDEYFHSAAYAVSADGSVVVGASSSGRSMAGTMGGAEGFRWTAGGGMHGVGVFPNIQQHTPALAVSDDGNTIVGYMAFGNGFYQGYVWTRAGGLVGLGNLPGYLKFGSAKAISADGTIIVGSDNTLGGPSGNQIVPAIRTPHAAWSAIFNQAGSAGALSADGSTVVGEYRINNVLYPFRWSADQGLRTLPRPPTSGDIQVTATNRDATVIIGNGTTATGAAAWIWSPRRGSVLLSPLVTQRYGLDLHGWQIVAVRSISGDGQSIVGTALNPLGDYEAFLLHLPGVSCAADANDDGTIDSLDLARFLLAFESASPEADVVPDGFIDGGDYDAFMRAYEAGC